MLSVIIFSEHCVANLCKDEELLTPYRFEIFPQSLHCLIKVSEEWENVGCQVFSTVQIVAN